MRILPLQSLSIAALQSNCTSLQSEVLLAIDLWIEAAKSDDQMDGLPSTPQALAVDPKSAFSTYSHS